MFKSNPVVAQILALTLITGFSAQALAAPAATPATPAKASATPGAVKVPTALELAQQDYVKSAAVIEDNVKVFLAHGESCGLIGTKMVENMKEKRALANQQNSRKQLVAVLTAANTGDEKQRSAAKKRVLQEIKVINEVYKEVDDNLDAIKMGLDTPTVPTCNKANKAFFLVRGTANKMLSSLDKAQKILGARKQANLLTDGAAAYGSHESAYDQAAAEMEFKRAQAEERIETSELSL